MREEIDKQETGGWLRGLFEKQALQTLERQVADPVLRERLTPDYAIGCKRVILSSTLYPALSRSNVTLHGRDQGIAALDERGIQTLDGQHIDLDLRVHLHHLVQLHQNHFINIRSRKSGIFQRQFARLQTTLKQFISKCFKFCTG